MSRAVLASTSLHVITPCGPPCFCRRLQEELLLTAIDDVNLDQSSQASAVPADLLPLLTRASNSTAANLSAALDADTLNAANDANASDAFDLRVWLPRKC